MRIVLLIAVLGTAAALTASAWGAVDPKDPQQHHTAADMKLAASIALRRADLARGWKAFSEKSSAPPCTAEPDESSLVQTAKVDPTFVWQDGVTKLGSEVDIFRTAAMAKEDWALSTLKLTTTCLLQAAQTGLAKSVHVTLVSSKALASPGLAERSLHYRLVLAVRAAQTVQVIADVVALGRGRITVVLNALTVNAPFPAAGLNTLAGRLADRLDAAGTGI